MFASLRVPVATAVYTLVGVLLAKYWFRRHPLADLARPGGGRRGGIRESPRSPAGSLRSKPMLALRTFESYWWINGLLAAVAACVSVLVAVKFTGGGRQGGPGEELVGQMSAALTTLIGGIVVATKDTDDKLGKMDRQGVPGQVQPSR